MGYHQAGFDVVGVDIAPQPNYPFEFIQADVCDLGPAFVSGFDAIHASPPCQIHSITAKLHLATVARHGDFISRARDICITSGKPYVIENVPGAPLIDPIMLCGTMFGLRVFRHRLFECSFFMMTPPHRQHRGTTNSSRTYSTFETGADMICVAGHNFKREDGAAAMGINWRARREEIAQAIPPAYTEFIGRQLIAHLNQQALAA
jgi:DNA (cytosine-5)-methyltransferase 1